MTRPTPGRWPGAGSLSQNPKPLSRPDASALRGAYVSAQLEQTRTFLQDVGVEPKEVFVDLGYRGVDQDNPGVVIHHRGKIKSMSKQQKRWLRRRQAVEPVIGHLKSDHRMDRCWLKGELGDALHAVLCAAGYNLRWLLRAILAGVIDPSFLRLILNQLRMPIDSLLAPEKVRGPTICSLPSPV